MYDLHESRDATLHTIAQVAKVHVPQILKLNQRHIIISVIHSSAVL